MKKKAKIGAPSSSPTPSVDLKSVIKSHCQFFDHLVELIPAKFYLSNDDDPKPWYQGLSKAAKASWKQQSRQNLKLARRNRLDPENKSSSSTLHLLQQQINKVSESEPEEPIPKGGFGDLEGGGEAGEMGVKSIDLEVGSGNANRGESVTYEELRQRLRKKIELLRGNRGEGGGKNVDDKKVKNEGKKRKRDENDGEGSGKAGNVDENDEGEDVEEIIEYGKVKLGDEEQGKNKKRKKKMLKVKELEKAKRLEDVKRQNKEVADRESWKAATSRAMGVKVHDNARLIKESMKKEKRKKGKNAEKWKERIETQEKMKQEKQQKRKDNIMGRIDEKKKRKIAKREKKLMRPGFEGRKEGYITNQD